MWKTTYAMVLLAGLFAVGAAEQAGCALNAAESVDEMLDSAVFIYAAIERCENKQKIRCSLDVSSAIESVNAMINVILKAVNGCGRIHTENPGCGLAVGVLTRSFAGLAAGSAGIIAKCPNALNNGTALPTLGSALGAAAHHGGKHASKAAGLSPSLGECIINVKDVLKEFFVATKRIMTVQGSCENPESTHCAHNSIKILAGFTSMGEYLAGTIGSCSANKQMGADVFCAQKSLELSHHLENVGRASVAMAKECKVEGGLIEETTTSLPPQLVPPGPPVNINSTQLKQLGLGNQQDTQNTSNNEGKKMARVLGLLIIAAGLGCSLAFLVNKMFSKTNTKVKKAKKVEEETAGYGRLPMSTAGY